MMKGDIIGLSGRKGSGKTAISEAFLECGYERKSFATALKTLVAHLMGIKICDVDIFKEGGIDFVIRDADAMFLSQETNIPLHIVKQKSLGVRFTNTRDALQYIGTDIIREYNSLWHVQKTMETLESGKKYVFDDVRFPNEKKAIEDLGGDCWLIVREKFDNISNHASETSLTYRDFGGKIIVNSKDTDLSQLKSDIKNFVINGYENSMKEREEYISALCGISIDSVHACREFGDLCDIAPLLLLYEDAIYVPLNFLDDSIITHVEFYDDYAMVTDIGDMHYKVENVVLRDYLKKFV